MKTKLLAIVLMLLTLCPVSFAQFGINKVQYENFDWQILKTPHFDIYYYPEEAEVAYLAADLAEESYNILSKKFIFEFDSTEVVPLIVYCSSIHFQQTNVISAILPESVGGFTEFIKGRVVIPFNGSYKDFYHVVRHELVHVFSSKKQRAIRKLARRRNIVQPPLWFEEGLAEYWSEGWTTDADALMREMTVSSNIISFSDLYQIEGTYLMYKVGQCIIKYLIETYGEEKFQILLDSWSTKRTFASVVESVYGKPLGVIGNEWSEYLKRTYYPDYITRQLPMTFATQLTYSGYNVEPTLCTLNGNSYLIYKHVSKGYVEIKKMTIGKGSETLIKDSRSPEFESLKFFSSSIGGTHNFIAFSAKCGNSDVLYVYDLCTYEIIYEGKFNNIIKINSPSFVPRSPFIVFSGVDSTGYSDLYIINIATGVFARLTNDHYDDIDPRVSPIFPIIAFSSDRASKTNKNIFLYDLITREISQVTYSNSEDKSPSWSYSSDDLLYTSNRNGSRDAYLIQNVLSDSSTIYRLTSSISSVEHVCMTPSGKEIFFTGYENFRYQIFCMSIDTMHYVENVSVREFNTGWKYTQSTYETKKYKPKYSVDFAQSTLGYDSYYGSIGGFQFALSDMLGDKYYYFVLFNEATRQSDFLKGINFASIYYDRKGRWNKGYGIFRFTHFNTHRIYGYEEETTFGALGVLEYPFDIFKRIEFTLQLRSLHKETITSFDPKTTVADFATSYVYDNTLWGWTGPVDGKRMRATIKQSYDIENLQRWSTTFILDFRNYLRLGMRSTFATRILGFTSAGIDPERIYLGGSWDLRGYPWRYYYGHNAVLFSNELRFPLIDIVYIRLLGAGIAFQGIETALFADIGKAWENDYKPMCGSFGTGLRVPLGGFTLRFDFSRRININKGYISSWDFDFFFGQDF